MKRILYGLGSAIRGTNVDDAYAFEDLEHCPQSLSYENFVLGDEAVVNDELLGRCEFQCTTKRRARDRVVLSLEEFVVVVTDRQESSRVGMV